MKRVGREPVRRGKVLPSLTRTNQLPSHAFRFIVRVRFAYRRRGGRKSYGAVTELRTVQSRGWRGALQGIVRKGHAPRALKGALSSAVLP